MSYDPLFLACALVVAAAAGLAVGFLCRNWAHEAEVHDLDREVQFAHNENLRLDAEVGALQAEAELWRSVAGIQWREALGEEAA